MNHRISLLFGLARSTIFSLAYTGNQIFGCSPETFIRLKRVVNEQQKIGILEYSCWKGC